MDVLTIINASRCDMNVVVNPGNSLYLSDVNLLVDIYDGSLHIGLHDLNRNSRYKWHKMYGIIWRNVEGKEEVIGIYDSEEGAKAYMNRIFNAVDYKEDSVVIYDDWNEYKYKLQNNKSLGEI